MKKDELIKRIPKSQTITLTYIKDENTTYIITRDEKKYFLYIVDKNDYRYLKSRTGDPLFKECYEEVCS